MAEYFVDADPGFGAGTAVGLAPGMDIANASFAVNTTGLSSGAHTLFIRSRQNPWSITAVRPFSVSIPLAMTLAHFSANKKGHAALLSWKTENKDGTLHFEIERNAAGDSWATIGSVPADRRGSYAFTDGAPPAGYSYYRLKMVKIVGDVAYSGTQRLFFAEATTTLTLRPSPQ